MTQKSILNIFFEGLKIFCLNIHKFALYMAFPVLGQLIGTFLIFLPVFWFAQNMNDLTSKYAFLNETSNFLLSVLVLSVPGIIILLKAFWDYLVAYGALNSMTEGWLNTSKVYDFKSHNEVVLKKTFSFVALWFLFSIFLLISIIPIFWIIGFIFFVYFILIFQVFTFEDGLSPAGYFKRSFELVRGNFLRTFILMLTLFVLTYILIPKGLTVLFDAGGLSGFMSKGFEAWAFTLPIEPLEPYGVSPAKIANSMVEQVAFFIGVGFTLPLRSICWTLLYGEYSKDGSVGEVPSKKRSKGKKSKDFKIEKREIDPEIIRRARLEDDEY